MSEQQNAEIAGLWIEYGKHNNGLWINAREVASIRNIGKRGSRGSIIAMTNGFEYETGYPATQLVSMLYGASSIPSANQTEEDR